MNKTELATRFSEFLSRYDEENKNNIWRQQSQKFKTFWETRILQGSALEDYEVDEIVRILDRHGRGCTKNHETVANVMISQGMFQRMFRDIKKSEHLKNHLDTIFKTDSDDERINAIDGLYKANVGGKNCLTGQTGTAVSAFLAAYDPFVYTGIVSLKHRQKLTQFFGIPAAPDFQKDSQGKKIVTSNSAIIGWFKTFGINTNARTLTKFVYDFKDTWCTDEALEPIEDTPGNTVPVNICDATQENISLFYMESQLEDFLVANWEKTELGKKYDLIEEDGEIVSQQYRTDIGIIDLLVRDKADKGYVVIELKRNQTSDDTIGQVARYMGWVTEKKGENVPVKGIIIAGAFDDRMYYAAKQVPNTTIYSYEVDFKIKPFKK
jgi:Holliday junction resolvase-like predicted endonuclease